MKKLLFLSVILFNMCRKSGPASKSENSYFIKNPFLRLSLTDKMAPDSLSLTTGCPNKFQTAAIAPVLGCAVGWLIPHKGCPLGPPIQQYEWLNPGPSLGKYFLKTSNFVSMETPKILYLLQRTAKFKAEYRRIYPMAVIVCL